MLNILDLSERKKRQKLAERMESSVVGLKKMCLYCKKLLPLKKLKPSKSCKYGRLRMCFMCYYDLYMFGGNRKEVFERDKYKCVKCGMTKKQHYKKYDVNLSVDHIDGFGRYVHPKLKNNSMDNLQTLCLSCHGRKDNSLTKLTEKQVLEIRNSHAPYSRFVKSSSFELAKKYNVSSRHIRRIVGKGKKL